RHDPDDTARHQRLDRPAGPHLILGSNALERERIGDVDVNRGVGKADLMLGSDTMVDQRELRAVLEPQRTKEPSRFSEIDVEGLLAKSHLIAAGEPLDLD